MTTVAIAVAKASVNDSFTNMKSKLSTSSDKRPEVDWNDFNWPPGLRIMHFRLDELEGSEIKIPVRNMFFSHLAVFIVTIINLINTIIQVAVGESGLRLFYTFVMIVFFNPL
jgi:hypothetical protein